MNEHRESTTKAGHRPESSGPPQAVRTDCLRVALTDACNERCIHCRQESIGLSPRQHLLTDEELLRLIRLFVAVGFGEVRFIGEPTLRSSIVELVRDVTRMTGAGGVSMTTSGEQLDGLARELKLAGLAQVNLTIKSFPVGLGGRPTRCVGLEEVLPAVQAVARAGIKLRIYSGVCRDLCERGDLLELARLTRRHAWEVRLVEQAPTAAFGRQASLQPMPRGDVLARLAANLGPLAWLEGSDPATGTGLFKIRGGRGTIGFINPAQEPFEDSCNHLRLTAEGDLRFCQKQADEVQLRMMMHSGASDEDLKSAIRRALGLHAAAGAGPAAPGAPFGGRVRA